MLDKSNFFAPWIGFNEMLTPRIIEIVYGIGLVARVLASIALMFGEEVGGGIVLLFGGSIVWRIWCELLIVVFKINENIQRIADRNDV